MDKVLVCLVSCAAVLLSAGVASARDVGGGVKTWRDPVSRYFHISYAVPDNAPDEVTVECSVSPAGKGEWHPAKVMPLISETALRLASDSDWQQWTRGGKITERRAAGLRRTVVFNPYPDAQVGDRIDVDFRVRITKPGGGELAEQSTRLQGDNSDVVYIQDWSKVIQRDVVTQSPGPGKWGYQADPNASFGKALFGEAGKELLPQLTYPLDLHGAYAIYVCTIPGKGRVGMRLTGDERTDKVGSPRVGEEVLWKWCRMDRQHLVIGQLHSYSGFSPASIDYVKLVPLTDAMVRELDSGFQGKHDKTVIGYFEPYSWAFCENIQETLQHRQPISAYAEAHVDVVDTQCSRFGMKSVYETRKSDQLLYETVGDPINGIEPETGNVGLMQQYTNMYDAELRYAREFGMQLFANFGASNCYIGTPLQGDFSKQHPGWLRAHALRFEVPEVRAYVLAMYREALEEGAPGISIDYCRYPECINKAETCTTFHRELRKLADEFGKRSGKPVSILVRFPATGVRQCECFDYRTWAKEGLVDYLCPSNIQGRHMSFDIAPYVAAVKGTKCKLTPVVDGISWGPQMPGPYMWRVKQLYDAGVDGVYIYQADDRVLGTPNDRRTVKMLGSSKAVDRFWQVDEQMRSRRSKGIYLSKPEGSDSYHGYERLRVWLEGIEMGPVELYLDGQLVSKYDRPPYTLGSEDYSSDGVIEPGVVHSLRVRAKDGNGWLEQWFQIKGGQ